MQNEFSPESFTHWRLLFSPPADGAFNMALDEALGIQVSRGNALPMLRFYAWEPPSLSLGRHQPYAEADEERCQADGVEIVRRPTGGRAILHTDELTYSITLPERAEIAQNGILETYQRLSQGLMMGLHLLGVPVEQAPATTRLHTDVSAACFEVPSAYEISAGGRKLMGSAQTRRRGYVLQHGTLPLTGDLTRVVHYLNLPNDQERGQLRQTMQERAVTLETVIGRAIPWQAAADALAEGFRQALHIQLASGNLSEDELRLAQDLRQSIYTDSAWTQRV